MGRTMTDDKEALILTFAFATVMGEVTRVRQYSRVAPHIDRMLEVWDNSISATTDMVAVATKVHSTLDEAYQMIDMTILQSKPTVGLLLERDVINALDAQILALVEAKGSALLATWVPADEEGAYALEDLRRSIEEISDKSSIRAIATVSGRDYYRSVVVGLAEKLNIPLAKEDVG